jgi:hypothetical protein
VGAPSQERVDETAHSLHLDESPCANDPSFSFGTFRSNGQKITRTCEWIKFKPSLMKQRQDNWCDKRIQGSFVKYRCPESCNLCCEDNYSYSFGSFSHNGEQIKRTCSWITRKYDLIQRRRNNWCHKVINGVKVEDECVSACGKCGMNDMKDLSNKFHLENFESNELKEQ